MTRLRSLTGNECNASVSAEGLKHRLCSFSVLLPWCPLAGFSQDHAEDTLGTILRVKCLSTADRHKAHNSPQLEVGLKGFMQLLDVVLTGSKSAGMGSIMRPRTQTLQLKTGEVTHPSSKSASRASRSSSISSSSISVPSSGSVGGEKKLKKEGTASVLVSTFPAPLPPLPGLAFFFITCRFSRTGQGDTASVLVCTLPVLLPGLAFFFITYGA